jgi:hypothetical protein
MTVTTIEPAAIATATSPDLHPSHRRSRGRAGGLELVTRPGDRLGRRRRADMALVEKARTHLWKPLLHDATVPPRQFQDWPGTHAWSDHRGPSGGAG